MMFLHFQEIEKLTYIGIIGLAILCAPLPSDLLPSFYLNKSLAPSEQLQLFVLDLVFLKYNP